MDRMTQRGIVEMALDAATRTFIEVSENGRRIGTMNTDDFVKEVSRLSGKRVAFVAEAVDVYNAQKKGEGLTARMVVEKQVRGKWQQVGRLLDAVEQPAYRLVSAKTGNSGRRAVTYAGYAPSEWNIVDAKGNVVGGFSQQKDPRSNFKTTWWVGTGIAKDHDFQYLQKAKDWVKSLKPDAVMDSAKPDYAANLALFLTEKKGRATAKWEGKMTAAEQRALFGQVLGKGTIEIDGTEETVAMGVKTGFGADYDIVKTVKWRDL